jgi:MerR family transcriptional regulator, light-induced transcriptional regulator
MVRDWCARGIAPFDLYLQVFQLALYEIGKKWELALISVAQEHVATAIVEDLIAALYQKIFRVRRTGRTAIVACVTDEYHQIAAKMVSDVFEMEGWDGIFVGGNTPQGDLVAMAAKVRPDVIGLSVSLDCHLADLEVVLPELQAAAPNAKLVVGGQALLRMREPERERRFKAEFIPSLVELRQLLRSPCHTVRLRPWK